MRRPEPATVASMPEPADMMAEVVRSAAEDSGAPDAVLRRLGSIQVVRLLSWRYGNPALAVAERLGLDVADLAVSANGGNSPQMLINQAALSISRGELDAAAVVGAEANRTRLMARAQGVEPHWSHQADDVAEPRHAGVERPGSSETETSVGMAMPVQVYPLFENALRAAAGESIAEHQARIAGLWSRFSQVAATNPYAWTPVARTADEIATPGPDNRMIAFPYPKLMNANFQTDQAAAVLVMSAEAAEAAGVPRDRWVFLRAGADAADHWFVSQRQDLSSSPAIRIAGQAALHAAGVGADDVAHVDLYSCFPAAVQIAAAELGFGLDEADRPLTVTGGLAYAGGPWNNYVTHSVATLCSALRRDPGSVGLATALGWYVTKHAFGVYSTEPGPRGFAWSSPQAEVDSLPSRQAVTGVAATSAVETYTVLYDRDGSRTAGLVTSLLPDGTRALARVADPSALEAMTEHEACGAPVTLSEDGTATVKI